MYIENINGPADVKKLNIAQMTVLASEMRDALLTKLSRHGGHFGPNFGMVEATIALHYVFESPKDKFVFDVSHQSYPHKMLTGRKDAFLYEEHYDDVSGYSSPHESEHDHFTIGHTSTSVSLACGLAKGRDLKGEDGNVVAIIGDGSLSGGEALEALDYAAELDGNLIILVNDNDMSIAENHGGLYQNLRLLRETGGKAECNLFRAMGLDYRFVADGNDIASLIEAFKAVKDSTQPVVVHIVTQKGKGYAPAEQHKEAWHYCAPFHPETGEPLMDMSGECYESITLDFMMKKMQADPSVCMITSGTPTVLGFTEEMRKKAGRQFIEEQTAANKKVSDEQVAEVKALLENATSQLDSIKTDLSEKVHSENVKCYRNIQDLFNEFDSKIEKMDEMEKSVGAVKGYVKVLSWFSIINFVMLVAFILYSLGVFNF